LDDKEQMMMRTLLIITVFSFLIIGCGSDDRSPEWASRGILKIGTDATYPPFEMVNTETGQPEGFDIDIMNKVCELNGWKPKYVITPFDGIISGLKGRKYDCIISAMSITPQREAIVSFSEAYYLAGQVIAVPAADTVIESVDDLRGRRVGVQLGTTGERMAKSLPGVTVFSFENIGAAFIDMKNGQIDAVLNDLPTTSEYIRRQGTAKIVGEVLSREYYGIAVRRGDQELLTKIDSALINIKESGVYDQIKSRWF
jgi:polar amino acid transport system substrate-binding protein